MEVRVVIDEGRLQFVYEDALVDLLDLGPSRTERVSAVEPLASGGGWIVLMEDGGTRRLGPCRLREDALALERAWLREHRRL